MWIRASFVLLPLRSDFYMSYHPIDALEECIQCILWYVDRIIKPKYSPKINMRFSWWRVRFIDCLVLAMIDTFIALSLACRLESLSSISRDAMGGGHSELMYNFGLYSPSSSPANRNFRRISCPDRSITISIDFVRGCLVCMQDVTKTQT